MIVRFKKLTPDAKIPYYATKGAACFDICRTDIESESTYTGAFSITFKTGLAVEVPEGYAMLIFSRSGHGFTHDVRLANCVGVIDSDYRGELKVKLTSDRESGNTLITNPGDRIAQGMVIPVEEVQFLEVQELSGSERGEKGFGSTGV